MTSAYNQLKSLPEVFTLNTLSSLTGGDSNKASVYVSRWKQMGLIEPMGPKLGVYFNLVKNPDSRQDHIMQAIKMLYPDAVMSGVSVLHSVGWTTQIPQNIDVNILARRSVPVIPGFDVHCRPKSWYVTCQPYISQSGFAKLKPEMALADAWKSKIWRPDPDDLDFDAIDTAKLKKAFSVLGEAYPSYYSEADIFQKKSNSKKSTVKNDCSM